MEQPTDSENQRERVGQTLGIWAHNRQLYPGWLLFPAGQERELLRMHTDSWERPILSSLPDSAPVQRLNAIRELVWRREILLEAISPEVETAAEAALKSIDCQGRKIDGIHDTQIAWGKVREAWRTNSPRACDGCAVPLRL